MSLLAFGFSHSKSRTSEAPPVPAVEVQNRCKSRSALTQSTLTLGSTLMFAQSANGVQTSPRVCRRRDSAAQSREVSEPPKESKRSRKASLAALPAEALDVTEVDANVECNASIVDSNKVSSRSLRAQKRQTLPAASSTPEPPVRRRSRVPRRSTVDSSDSDDQDAELQQALALSVQEVDPSSLSVRNSDSITFLSAPQPLPWSRFCKNIYQRSVQLNSFQRVVRSVNPALLHSDIPRLVSNRFSGRVVTREQYQATSSNGWQPFALDASATHIVAGGKAGWAYAFERTSLVAEWDDDYEPVSQKIGWAAHSRWISEVQLLAPQLIATSSDDGSLALWNMAQSDREGEPKCLQRLSDFHDDGIYGFHVSGQFSAPNRCIATASKDSSIALFALTPARAAHVRQLSEYHSAVVKCVRWQSDSQPLLASVGNDRVLNVFDTRATEPLAIKVQTQHDLAVNTVAWRPGAEHFLITSSFDKTIQMIDIRRPDGVLFSMNQHWPSKESRASAIFHPTFSDDGLFVCATSAKYSDLLLYSATDGELLRRAALGFSATQICTLPRVRRQSHEYLVSLAATVKNRVVVCDIV